jgi:hypothetical protein
VEIDACRVMCEIWSPRRLGHVRGTVHTGLETLENRRAFVADDELDGFGHDMRWAPANVRRVGYLERAILYRVDREDNLSRVETVAASGTPEQQDE